MGGSELEGLSALGRQGKQRESSILSRGGGPGVMGEVKSPVSPKTRGDGCHYVKKNPRRGRLYSVGRPDEKGWLLLCEIKGREPSACGLAWHPGEGARG